MGLSVGLLGSRETESSAFVYQSYIYEEKSHLGSTHTGTVTNKVL